MHTHHCGNNANFSLQPVLKTCVLNDDVVSPCTRSASLLSDDAISDLYTTVVQYLTPYEIDSQNTAYYTCTCDTQLRTDTPYAYRYSHLHFAGPLNLCNFLDYMCYHNMLSSYDPVEHTYVDTTKKLEALSTNNAVFSADAVGYYDIPAGYEFLMANISLTNYYEVCPSINKRVINATHDVTARIADYDGNTYASINCANDTVPLALGCSIIFSATQLPDKYLYIGVKGGYGGYVGDSAGKIISPSQITSLGNNLYLFNGVICENLPFMTQTLSDSRFYDTQKVNAENSTYKILTSAFNFSTTIVTDSTLYYNASVMNTDTSTVRTLNFSANNTRKLENFNVISTSQWLTCTKLNEDYALQIQPATAVITPRYDLCQTIQYVKNNTKYLVHSTEYSAFGVSTGTSAVLNWGDTSLITNMQGSFASSKVQSIPETWGNWSNLTGANAMFYGTSELHDIPASWQGLSAVKDASMMFYETSVEHIPDSWEGLDSVEKMNNAFMKSTVSNIPTDLFEMCPNINNISAMFSQCYKLTAASADIETFIDKAIAHGLTTAQYKECFLQCSAIENYDGLKTKYPDWF